MTLLAAFQALLARYSGQDDIVVGSPIAGRDRRELEALIGFFVNTLVLRADLSGDPTFRRAARAGARDCAGRLSHQELPFSRVVERRGPSAHRYPPLVQVMFGFLDKPVDPIELPGLALHPLDIGRGTGDVDLFLTMYRSADRLRGVWSYNADLFDATTMAQLAESFCACLEACVREPALRLSQLPLAPALAARARPAQQRGPRHTIAITATFTAEPLREALSFWMDG